MENIRLVLIISLSFITLLLWEAWQEDYEKPDVVPSLSTNSGAKRDVPPNISRSDTPAPAIAASMASTSLEESAPIVNVRTDLFDLDINSFGGVINRAALIAYPLSVYGLSVPFTLLGSDENRFFVLQGGLKSESSSPDHHAIFKADQKEYVLKEGENELTVNFRWVSEDGISVTKQFIFSRGSYKIGVRYQIQNKSSNVWKGHLYDQLQRKKDADQRHLVNTFTGAALSTPENRYQKLSFKDLTKTPINVDVKDGWVAILEHYFVSALLPPRDAPYHYYSVVLDETHYAVGFYGPAFEVPAGETKTVGTTVYVGPKLQNLLPNIAPGLELTVDYGALWFIAKIIFWALAKIHSVTGNWGWGIILVTLLLKGMFYPLSAAGYRSMANMRRVQPRLLALRDRYKDDRTRLNQAMMELYKQEKINPLGGCLPIIIQIPVFIALYYVLLESVELRQAPFIFWIKDLSIKDPYFVLPLLMGISMWFQQRLNPAPLDPVQAKVMQILPIVFTVFFAFFPSGLVLYWFINNVLSITQQWIITRKIEQAALGS